MIREIVCSRPQFPPPEKQGMKSLLSVLFVFAIAVFAIAVIAIAVIAIAVIAARTASASPMMITPAGLNSVDQFRIAFVTSAMANATSSDLSTYDSV